MNSIKVTVYGRVKPCPENLQSKEFRIKKGENEDQITFTTQKPIFTKKSFRFRKIFNGQATQEEVFDEVAKPVIENVLSGYNGTIFTYGQTGSGKTYTMTGDIENWNYPGLIPRTIQNIFQLKKKDVTVSITYCEIYNEHIYDLIRSERIDSDVGHASMLEDSSGVTRFRNLSVHIANTPYEAIELLIRGDANKMVAETTSNAKSSRSHVLFSITLELPHPDHDKLYMKPVLYLVDLAGSERLSKCKTPMANPWETRYINLSLHYLEQVLLALRQPGRVHIPYRNSLMTALLRNSLGGNCITSMIATFCLSVENLDETMQTCRFAERIALIKNEVRITETFNTEREIEELRQENRRLKFHIELLSGQPVQEPNQDLTQEDKEKCADMVQNFIESSTVEDLPFTDVKKIEYCFFLMRERIVKKGNIELTDSKTNPALDFFKNCSRVSLIALDAQRDYARTLMKAERYWKKKKNMINLPKVNITYKRMRSTDNFEESEEVEAVRAAEAKKANFRVNPQKSFVVTATQTQSSRLNPIVVDESFEEKPRTGKPEEENANQMTIASHFAMEEVEEEKINSVPETERKNGQIHSSVETENRGMMADDAEFCATSLDFMGATGSGATFKIEVQEESEEKSPGECFTFGKLRKLINIGLQVRNDIEIESEEEIDISEEDGESEGGSQFSTTYLPLTGDEEVDEEILKFYKARFKKFKEQEKDQC